MPRKILKQTVKKATAKETLYRDTIAAITGNSVALSVASIMYDTARNKGRNSRLYATITAVACGLPIGACAGVVAYLCPTFGIGASIACFFKHPEDKRRTD